MAQTAVDIVVKTIGADKLRALDRQLKGIEPSARKASRAVDGVSKAVVGLGRALATAALGDQLRRSFGAAAEFSATQQRVRNLTQTYQQFIGIQNLAAQSAQKFGISNAQALSDLTDLGSRLGATGASLRDLENIYQGFNTLLVNNAVGAQQAAAATLQLNQALGSGRLAGEEFNAINEATPQLLDEVARVLNVARGELKELASKGKISSQVLLKALQNIKTQGADALAGALDTPAGKLRQFDAAIKDFQVSVGTELLPVITPLVQELTKLVRGFGELPEPIRTAAVAAAAAAVGFGALNLALGTLGINLVALTGGALTKLATGLAIVGGGAKTTAVGFTAAGAAITKTTLAINAATIALGALKVAIIALPLAALAAVLNENIQKKREFDDVMRSNSPDVLTGKINQLTQQKEELKSTLQSIQGGRWYKGMESDINQIQGQINELDAQIDAATRRRQLIVDIQVQGAIPGFDQLSDAGIQEALRLAGVNKPPTPVPVGGGGGGGGGRESQLPQLQAELQLSNQLLENDRQRLQAQFDSNTALVNKLAQDRIELELAGQKAAIALEDIPAAEKKLKVALAENEATLKTLELKNQIAEADRQRAEAIQGITQPLEDELELLQAKLNGNEDEIRQLQEIRDLKKQILALDPNADTSGVEAMVKQRDAMREQVAEMEKTKKLVGQISGTIASEFTGAIRSVIDGTKSVDQAFSDMLKNIGEAFIDMALKIIEQQIQMIIYGLIMKALGIAAGGASGGASTVPGGAYGDMSVAGPGFFGGGMIPGFAEGGQAQANRPYMVGERGPELFVPNSSGTIVSNEQSRAQLDMYSPGNAVDAPAGPMNVNMNYSGPTMAFDDKRYLPIEAVPAIIKDAAKQGEQRALSSMRNRVSTRNRVGI